MSISCDDDDDDDGGNDGSGSDDEQRGETWVRSGAVRRSGKVSRMTSLLS